MLLCAYLVLLEFIFARGVLNKEIIWELSSRIVRQLEPSLFVEIILQLQSKYHAWCKLAYYTAAAHYERHSKEQILVFSVFNNPTGFVGSPPFIGYLTAMYTDYVNMHYKLCISSFIVKYCKG